MIILTVFIEIILIGLMVWFFCLSEDSYEHEVLYGIIGMICLLALFIVPIGIGCGHGYINYIKSNDKDKARIVAITQKQDFIHAYYEIEVEYLTNTPDRNNRNIEKDTFYCYINDESLVKKVQDNLYKEVWIISGYKGGYETWVDFGTNLLKDIELIEE